MWVQSLGQEDLLKEEMATHSVFLPENSHRSQRRSWQATVHGVSKSWTRLSTHTHNLYAIKFIHLEYKMQWF